MGCTCSKASQPSRPPTLLEHRPQSALPQAKPTDIKSQATEGAREGADENVPSSVSCGATTAESSLKPDVTLPVLEGEEDTSRDCWFCCRAPTQTQSLESWELQLLRVSSELKMKLKDPHFVAKRCDLDSSGDLDMHELKQASRAFGIKFSTEELQERMAGEARINKERFAQIVADAPVTSADRSRPTIPHSLRGMALGQLQQLESIFITSGWLSDKCNAFNLEHANAIREGKKFPQAANLYAMDTFVVTPMSQPDKCDARDQDSANVVPEANEKMSFSEVANPYGLIVHCFVSHFWGHLFSQTITALRRWAEMNCEPIGAESSKAMVYWICLFALNQHAVADEVGENPMQGPFNAALAQAEGGAVMVLDEEINPFKRIWCLFEISRLRALNQPFELICEMGSLSRPESLTVQQTDPAAAERLLQNTCEALWQVSAQKAKASVEEDRTRILKDIANPHLRKGIINFLHVGWVSGGGDFHFYEEMYIEFDRFSQSLLSSALLQFCLMHNNYAAAAKCCEKGACFTKEQFAQINTCVREEDRTSWLSNLLILNTNDNRLDIVGLLLQSGVCMEAVQNSLICAAQYGHGAVTKLLLDNGANVSAANINGKAALMLAALGGHETVTKLLLDNAADVAAADFNGDTALIYASVGGNETVTRLLLDYGAFVATANIKGRTALMVAAQCGHEEVTRVLLDCGADVAAANLDGTTVLMCAADGGDERATKLLGGNGADVAAAAARGHEKVTKLLLDHGADVAAADNKGVTALMCAARGGHKKVTKLLLENGADVAAADNNGVTALIYASVCGHETVAKLLLDYGANVAANEEGSSALMVAAKRGHVAVAKLLLDYGLDVAAANEEGSTALMAAAKGGHEEVTKLLLDHGADVAAADIYGVTALMASAQGGHVAVTQLLLENGADVAAAARNGVTALIYAAIGGSEAVTKVLLHHGVDVAAVNKHGCTALMVAAKRGHVAVAKLLLDYGADVAAANEEGSTALMAAAKSGHEEVTKLLLDHGADVAAADIYGVTALKESALGGHEEVSKLLLDRGADVAAADNKGVTALMASAQSGHVAVTQLLLENGADVAAAARNGVTALIYAAIGGSEAVTKVLLHHGVDVAAVNKHGWTALMVAA